MTKSIPSDSPLFTARMAGALWLAVIVISGVDAATSPIGISSDAVTTAHSILASEFRYRLGVLAEIVAGTCYLGVTVLLYQLLQPVSKGLALFAACCGAIGLSIGATLTVPDLGVVPLLKSAQLPSGDAAQTQAIAVSSIRMFRLGFTVSMVYFGFQCATVGYLIARSGFIPKAIGILLAIGGSFYVISSLTTFLSPTAGSMLGRVVIPVAFIGEGATMLWLLFKGVNVAKWHLRTGVQPTPLVAA